MRVLVLDDNVELLDLAARFLAKTPAVSEVLTASTSTEAKRLAEGTDIRVFLVAELLGDPSGIAFIESARKRHPGSRFLHFAADERWKAAAEALQRGADGVLKKSSWTELLVEAVRRVGNGEVYIDPGYSQQIVESLRSHVGDGLLPLLPRPLTEVELLVLRGIARGETSATIAARRGVKKDTVKHQARSAREKLGVDDRSQLVVEARRRGLV